jgi:hypothetical protein
VCDLESLKKEADQDPPGVVEEEEEKKVYIFIFIQLTTFPHHLHLYIHNLKLNFILDSLL